MPPARAVALVLLAAALHAFAREVDGAVGLLLHTSLDLPRFVAEALALVEPGPAVRRMAVWTLAAAAGWVLLAGERRWREGGSWRDAFARETATFSPLFLRPALTVLALLALAARPTYPYGFTLPVALTQDWSFAQDAAAAAAIVAHRVPAVRVPAPGAGSLALLAFLAYAHLTPAWARQWEGHPGNEPKTLRMAVALGHALTLDVEGVSAGMEVLPVEPLARAVPRAAGTLARESARLAMAALEGPDALGADAIRATRVTRQTVRGKEGGVFHVLAPGPSFLLAPTLRVDRAQNIRRGTPGWLGTTVLFWNALAAMLVAAVYLLARDASGRTGPSAMVAAAFALVPPGLFYSFQFYPEMPGALALALLFRAVAFVPPTRPIAGWGLGLLLATLPWLHQKFLPVWIVLAVMLAGSAVNRLERLGTLLGLLVPQVVSGLLFLLYNFAITGSARPDALFLAWGPRGVSTDRMGHGLLGLLLDARYGLLPYVPAYLLALGALVLPGARAARLRRALPAAAVYYVTVAAADNWSGAVCNLGRYIMPVAPWMAAGVALALARASRRPGVRALALTLAAWTVALAIALWRDPHAANDCALLLAKAALADGNVYVPNLFLQSWADAAPGLAARILVWAALLGALALWIRSAAAGRAGGSAPRTLAGLAALALACALVLERWPLSGGAPHWPDAVELKPGVVAFLDSQSGGYRVLVRSREPMADVIAVASGEGVVRVPGRPPVPVGPAGARVSVPLRELRRLMGRRGVSETLYLQEVSTQGGVRLALDSETDASSRSPARRDSRPPRRSEKPAERRIVNKARTP